MVLSRPIVARGATALRLSRAVRPSIRKTCQPTLSRSYASGGGAHAASSDIPWLLGAIAVTVPSVYYLWPAPAHGDAGHGHGGHGHAEEAEHEDKEETEEKGDEEDSKEEPASDDKPEQSEKGDDAEDKSEEKPQDKPEEKAEDKSDDSKPAEDDEDSSEPEKTSNKKVDGVQFKGKTSAGDENNEMTDTRKREPDSKGAFKKRIDSHYQKDLGAGEHFNEDGTPSGKTAATPSNDPGAIDTKQKGLSSTATRHSTAIHEDPEKSKKGEGVPETAKSMTTVSPNRPAK